MSKAYENELDSLLTSSSVSETLTPRQGGASLISELTSSGCDVVGRKDTSEDVSKYNVGRLIGNVSKTIQEDDAVEYKVATVMDICDGDLSLICRDRRAGGKNTFCTAINCVQEHRSSSPKVNLSLDDIVIIRTKNAAFVSPIGSSKNISNEVLKEWKSQLASVADWSHRFLLASSSEDKSASFEDLKSMQDFGSKASSHKTPSKPPQVKVSLSPFTPHDKEKFIKSMVNLKSDGFGKTSLEYFDRVDKQFANVENVVDNVVKNVNNNSSEIFTTLRMLEFEKNKIKSEVGNRNNVFISESFDAASLWEVVEGLADSIDGQERGTGRAKIIGQDKETGFGKADIASFRSFESYARGMLNQQDSLLRKVALQSDVDRSLDNLNFENQELRKENKWLAQRLLRLEADVVKLQQDQDQMNVKMDFSNPRIASGGENISGELEDEIRKMKRDLEDLKPSTNSMKFNFQDLSISNLTEMHGWLTAHVKSFNYSLITDLHTMFENITHSIHPSKSPLDLLQAIKKIDMPTPSHAITIQSHEQSLPRYFYKPRDHRVIRSADSHFDNIKTFEEWIEPNYGFRDNLTERRLAVQNAIEDNIL